MEANCACAALQKQNSFPVNDTSVQSCTTPFHKCHLNIIQIIAGHCHFSFYLVYKHLILPTENPCGQGAKLYNQIVSQIAV